MSSPDSWPPLREVIARHDLRAEKKLGQNFLLDSNITDKIARLAGDLAGKTVFEIGSGPGGLTRSLLKAGAARVVAIEFDQRAVRALQELEDRRLEIIQGDALETDLTALEPAPRAIVANLPYNIATPLLVNWLRQVRNIPGAFESMTLMFQKEVAERITAQPGTKAYGRLAVLCQWLCEAKKVYDLPPAAFTPPPRVSSAVVRFVPRVPEKNAPAFGAVEAVTAAAFGQRRKMIRTSLQAYTSKLEQLGIDPSRRAETLSVKDFIRLA
ncbi:MAG: 16S rRNA (adenine(1518)-N(6)/adenine(1519)-N(6))-dimethyltransferase RsmA [Alphaproteobacteria bacterium]|nr:16S rRNA (adenine(1518)-N(6)/adenine(1519)-N(6))-dimethyltransferase RsmA [Alphaproteobacteria bacterium]